MRDTTDTPVRPDIALVIPLHGHATLVWEAIETALSQNGETRYALVLVNDGCKFASSDLVGLAAAAEGHGIPFAYVAQKNRGLSAARNTGIEAALTRWPGLRALYMLDSDNRLTPRSVTSMIELLDRHPDVDWFYPDIRTVGLRSHWQIDGPFSRQLNISRNMCEAGSLIRRRILDAGVRYDEAMKKGYEDWEFWLAVQEAGFTNARHSPEIEFRYRKRPESMLRDSERVDSEIRDYMRRKHPWTTRFTPEVEELETGDAPLLLITEAGARFYFAEDAASRPIPVAEAADHYWRWRLRPGANAFPWKVLCARQSAVDHLRSNGLMPWAIYDLHSQLEEKNLSFLSIESHEDDVLRISDAKAPMTGPDFAPDMMLIETDLLAPLIDEKVSTWLSSLWTDTPAPVSSHRSVTTPGSGPDRSEASALQLLWQTLMAFSGRSVPLEEAAVWQHLKIGAGDRKGMDRTILSRDGLRTPAFPIGRRDRKQVAFVVPFADFGGVERVAYQVGRTLAGDDYDVHLVCLLSQEIHTPEEFRRGFASVSWFTGQGLNRWTEGPYRGTRLAPRLDDTDHERLVALLRPMDAVINCHSIDLPNVMGELKRNGTLCLDYQHVVDLSPSGVPQGHPVVHLAYEHAYAGTLCCSQGIADWLEAHGASSEKLHVIRNGPGISVPRDVRAQSRVTRKARLNGLKRLDQLNVLFMGRLDRQKGLDRLCELIEGTTGMPEVHWRIVGKNVVEGAGGPALPVRVEPPVYASEDIREKLAWADLMVLPSRYEGLPLAIIDAMAMGVPTIVTDVGAVGEAITHGQNGLIFPQEDYVAEARQALEQFITEPGLLADMSSAASDRAEEMNWETAIAPLRALLGERLA